MMRNSVNNYILRIYRLDRKKPQSLVGLVEEVEAKEKKAFTNLQELWDILRHPKPNSTERRKRGSGEPEMRREGEAR